MLTAGLELFDVPRESSAPTRALLARWFPSNVDDPGYGRYGFHYHEPAASPWLSCSLKESLMLLGVSFRIDYSDQVDGVYLYTPKLGLYHEVDISFGDTGAMFPSLTASSWLDLFIAAITSR